MRIKLGEPELECECKLMPQRASNFTLGDIGLHTHTQSESIMYAHMCAADGEQTKRHR